MQFGNEFSPKYRLRNFFSGIPIMSKMKIRDICKSSIRVSKPRRTKQKPYSHVVTFYNPGETKRTRCFFKTYKAANNFYDEKVRELTEIQKGSAITDNQHAEDILVYRDIQMQASKIGISPRAMVELYIKYTKTLSDAGLPSLNEAMQQYIRWRKENNPGVTLSRAVSEYIAEYLPHMRPNSAHSAELAVKRLCRDLGSFLPITDLNENKIESWVTNLKNTHPKPRSKIIALSTQHAYFRHVAGLLSFCRKRGYISQNSARKVMLPAVKRKDPGVYSPEDIAFAIRLFPASSQIRLYICIAAFTGIRPEEIGRLKWSDVNMRDRVITLSSEITKVYMRRNVNIQDNLAEWLESEWKDKFDSDEFVLENRSAAQ